MTIDFFFGKTSPAITKHSTPEHAHCVCRIYTTYFVLSRHSFGPNLLLASFPVNVGGLQGSREKRGVVGVD